MQEECGYKVNNLEYITSFSTAVGHSGAKQSLFYAEIDENDRVSTGGGVDGEVIKICVCWARLFRAVFV